MEYKLVIFDLDGTLIDTIEDLGEAVNYALRKRGLPLHSLEEYRGMVGHGVRNLVAQALGRSLAGTSVMPGNDRASEALVDEALADFTEYYCAHIDVHTRPYPGMVDLVKDLDAAGVRMAVASNKFQSGTEKLVHEFFPGIPFVAILGNREGCPLKPDPEIVGEILRAAGIAGQAGNDGVVLVGDSGTDMQTARNGGIPAIAVGWGYRPMGPSGEWQYAGSVTELRTLLFGRPFFVSEQMNTPPEQPSSPLQKAVYEAFARLAIPFVRVDTDPGITMEDCLHIDEGLGARIVKTVFVCNRQQTEFYLYVMPSDKPFVTREFCAALGIPRVSFASAEKLLELTGVAPGATTILSAVWPDAAGVHLVMDSSVATSEWFACTDGTDTCFVKLRTRDLLEAFIPACGQSVMLI